MKRVPLYYHFIIVYNKMWNISMLHTPKGKPIYLIAINQVI